jgi:3-keto-disaccharide hydrolase
MSNEYDADFDPYYRWLGISKAKRPVNYYQLLGVSPKEQDCELIKGAADRQKMVIKSFEPDPGNQIASALLYEIEEACFILLDSDFRRQYNIFLKEKKKKKGWSRAYKRWRKNTLKKSELPEDYIENSIHDGFIEDFFILFSIIFVGFILMATISFYLPWSKINNTDDAKPVKNNVKIAQNAPIPQIDKNDKENNLPEKKNFDIKPDNNIESVSFRPLFDGKTFKGWKTLGSNKIIGWKIQNSQLRTTTRKKVPYLVTKSSYDDFEFQCEFWMDKKANSGIYLRGRYEVQLLDDDSYPKVKAKDKCGALFGLLEPSQSVYRGPQKWNELKVRLEGKIVTIVMNGKTIINRRRINKVTGQAIDKNENQPGPIAIQHYGDLVRFRNIKIRRLESTNSKTVKVVNTAEESKVFTSLFNGKTLKGWKGDRKIWKVKDGTILGTSDSKTKMKSNNFLFSTTSYENFVLKAKFKLYSGNSGIQFRSKLLANNSMSGYQADIAYEKDFKFLGWIYGEKMGGKISEPTPAQKRALLNVIKVNDWNEMEVTANGDHLIIDINGVITADVHHQGPKSGLLGFQLQKGTPMSVSFKDIMIKELP